MHAGALLDVWGAAKLEPLRVCAASALSRLLCSHPVLTGAVISHPAFLQQVLGKPCSLFHS